MTATKGPRPRGQSRAWPAPTPENQRVRELEGVLRHPLDGDLRQERVGCRANELRAFCATWYMLDSSSWCSRKR